MRPRLPTTLAVATLTIALTACSSSGGDHAASTTAPSQPSTTTTRVPPTLGSTVARPAGPAATLHEITGPGQPFVGEATGGELASGGYEQHEYIASGAATSYRVIGSLTADGHWKLAPATTASYATRVLVRRPSDPKRFSGHVLVEWMNVSGGVDADPEWTSLREEIMRAGDAWVGVSVQRNGVMGGPVLVSTPGANIVAGKGLRGINAARYGKLHHPGDGWMYDIYTQAARAVRAGAVLGDISGPSR